MYDPRSIFDPVLKGKNTNLEKSQYSDLANQVRLNSLVDRVMKPSLERFLMNIQHAGVPVVIF